MHPISRLIPAVSTGLAIEQFQETFPPINTIPLNGRTTGRDKNNWLFCWYWYWDKTLLSLTEIKENIFKGAILPHL